MKALKNVFSFILTLLGKLSLFLVAIAIVYYITSFAFYMMHDIIIATHLNLPGLAEFTGYGVHTVQNVGAVGLTLFILGMFASVCTANATSTVEEED
jgi:hypothetical protein